MSLSRSAQPLLRSFSRVSASASGSSPSAPSRGCPECFRSYSSSFNQFGNASRRRHLQTASAFQPRVLPPPPPPMQSVLAAETSLPVGSTQSSLPPPGRPIPMFEPMKGFLPAAEVEKQAAKPVEAPLQPPTPLRSADLSASKPLAPRAKRGKLRPRKAAITLTATAVEKLREILDQPNPKLIRVGVKNRGCSGLAYHLEYVDKAGMFDETVEQDGVKVLVDSKALFSIIGSEMDWHEDPLSQKFIFKNPNITEQCGCGESFSIS